MLERAIWTVLGLGALLRLWRYLSERSLWLDESLLALNLISKSAGGLLDSLDYVQSAPPGFLLIQRTSVRLFGEAELSLRLFPFLAALAGLLLFALVARRLLRPELALVTVAIYSLNEPLIYQSSEAKPYSSDVAIALFVVWLTLRALDGLGQPGFVRDTVPLAVAGVAAVALSFPAVFVVGAAAGALLLAGLRRANRGALPLLVCMSATWAAAFLVVYALSAETIASVRAPIFGGGGGGGGGSSGAAELVRSAWYVVADPGGFERAPHALAALLILIGIGGLAVRAKRERLVLIGGPILLAFGAAAVDRYPLGGRFSLFLVPFLALLLARGLADLAALLRGGVRRPAVVVLGSVLLLAVPLKDALARVADPPRGEDVRPLIARLVREWKPGDGVYVFRNTQYAFRYYSDCDDCGVSPYPFDLQAPPAPIDNDGTPVALVTNPPEVFVGVVDDAKRETRNLSLISDRERVWALFSHVGVGHDRSQEDDRILQRLEQRGRRLASWREPGADLYLYRIDD